MRRADLEHAIRAAADVAQDDEIVVIGGQAIRVETGRGGVATGWCLEAHDLVLAKCAASRERDWAYAETAVCAGLVDPAELLRRAPSLPLGAAQLDHVLRMLSAMTERPG